MRVSPGLRGRGRDRAAPATRSIVVDGRHLRVDVTPGARARRSGLSAMPGRARDAAPGQGRAITGLSAFV